MRDPRLLRISGLLIALGLTVEGVSLIWAHPTAFVLFLVLGASLVGVGVMAYFWYLLRRQVG